MKSWGEVKQGPENCGQGLGYLKLDERNLLLEQKARATA